jgi:hypothetical protein
MKCYKLTDQKMQTYHSTQWGENVTHTTDGQGDLMEFLLLTIDYSLVY